MTWIETYRHDFVNADRCEKIYIHSEKNEPHCVVMQFSNSEELIAQFDKLQDALKYLNFIMDRMIPENEKQS